MMAKLNAIKRENEIMLYFLRLCYVKKKKRKELEHIYLLKQFITEQYSNTSKVCHGHIFTTFSNR